MKFAPFCYRLWITFHLISVNVSSFVDEDFDADGIISNDTDTDHSTSSLSIRPTITLSNFQNILYSELHNLIIGENPDLNERERQLLATDSKNTWNDLIQHGWYMNEHFTKQLHDKISKGRREMEDFSLVSNFPFLICSQASGSGYQRLQHLTSLYPYLNDQSTTIISNNSSQTCFHASISYNQAIKIESASLEMDILHEDRIAIVPMTDVMKISFNTMKEVSSEKWPLPSSSTNTRGRNKNASSDDWGRILRITLSVPDKGIVDSSTVSSLAEQVLQEVQNMAKDGSKNRRRRRSLRGASSSSVGTSNSITDSFSLTSRSLNKSSTKRELMSEQSNFWARSLESGVEADHFCQVMFETMQILSVHDDLSGFDVILNPSPNDSEVYSNSTTTASTSSDSSQYQESSASNVHCITSFIIGLSVHPLVRNIEADSPISPHDFESQSIIQSGTKTTTKSSTRPLFDIGLTGSGQIVSISDSGLDINHDYFGPTYNTVFDQWDPSQRKVVRYEYDSYGGDSADYYRGHGTRIANIIAGSLKGTVETELDGIAKDAKLHIWDIQKTTSSYMVEPGPTKLFSSMSLGFIDDDGKTVTSSIMNASWGSSYRPYSVRCKLYDYALEHNYDHILFVTSAGNDGTSDASSAMNTIGDPASCKNSLAVGSSQSLSNRIGALDLGPNYMTAFSSRGPTMDGRIKPDIVAPGYNIITVDAYGSGRREVDGTSYSSAVISGSAALVRQYYQEGWYPCGKKGCGEVLNPSGSLLKATLINGVENLKGVQQVPNGALTEEVTGYDNNQGFGLPVLTKSLRMIGVNKLNNFVVNNDVLEDGAMVMIYVRAKRKKECNKNMMFSTTLAWYDPSGSVGCVNCLLNDLDLSVRKVNKRNVEVGPIYYPNGFKTKDTKNNVEKVRLRMKPLQRYVIKVHASNLASMEAKFSLIASGCFTQYG